MPLLAMLVVGLVASPLEAFVPSASGLGNPCNEGEFLDLDENVCRPLVKSYGFDPAAFLQDADTTEHDLSSCDPEELKTLLGSMSPAGGVVNLPSCTMTLTRPLSLPSNVVLQGAGSGETIIKAGGSMPGDNMVRAVRVRNVVVRDLTIDGSGVSGIGLLIWYSTNVLAERLEVINTANSGVIFRYAQLITIRYVEATGHTTGHGIGSKDCFPGDEAVPDLEECAAQAGDTAPGVLWSRDYAVYSNHASNNPAGYGLDLHASGGEIAGNSIQANRYGVKLPDTTQIWFHHNEVLNNSSWGLHIYGILDIPERAPRRHVIYENSFGGNGNYPIRVHSPSLESYLLFNTYSSNSPNRLRVQDSEIFVCAGSEDALLEVDGGVRKEATPAQCDLSQVGAFWSEPAECFQLTLTHSGEGGDPFSAPTNSPGCIPGSFKEGTRVALFSTPECGWEISGWDGTDDNGSTSADNVVTKLAWSQSTGVYYSQMSIPNSIVLKNMTLSGTQAYEAWVSVRVGPDVEIGPGAVIRLTAPDVLFDRSVNLASDALIIAETADPEPCPS